MASASTSNIRAFVQWKEPTVFSGEDIECLITFKNTAGADEEQETDDKPVLRPRFERQRTVTQSTAGLSASRGHFSASTSLAGTADGAPSYARGTADRTPSYTRGHRPALSLNVVPTPALHGRNPSAQSNPHTTALHGRNPSAQSTPPISNARPRPSHSRSLSILSMGSHSHSHSHSPALPQKTPPISSSSASRRPARGGHGRSASLHVMSHSAARHPSQSSIPHIMPFSPSIPNSTPNESPDLSHHPDFLSIRPNRRRSGISTAPNTPAIVLPPTSPDATFAADFAFPPVPAPDNIKHASDPPFEFPPRSSNPIPTPHREPSYEKLSPANSPNPSTHQPAHRQPSYERLSAVNSPNPIARVLSDVSANGTSRASSDMYSLDNNSSDTAASELPSRMPSQSTSHPPSSRTRSSKTNAEPELLMMGYAQTVGSFVLDASLVNQAPFDQVKRKGVLGGQAGGGVVGLEQRSKRESGFFSSFAWTNVGESLGGLLGGGEMSSIKDMRTVAATKTIPLLSTPQSLLFVDLRLAPGQTRSYTYRFQLPRGLPPTHKGRAIKVNYHVRIGVQRSGSLGAHQNLKHIDVPFRVLGSVNSRGESLGHDLMSPYIILHDRAHTATVPTPAHLSLTLPDFPSVTPSTDMSNTSPAALKDFMSYADLLLTSKATNGGLLSPGEELPRRRSSTEGASPANVKEAIDLAILRSNLSSDVADHQSQSTNRFTIARSGQTVAVLSIVRPAYRLGETISGMIDFAPPHAPGSSAIVPTYTMNITLETVERVDPSLALRSASSIQRATRKAYAHASENVLFTRQTSFRLEIPASATPTFETTGVHLSWRLRVEFVTARATARRQSTAQGLGISAAGDNSGSDEDTPLQDGTESPEPVDDLLEEVMRDDRGTVLVAKERLVAETFEVSVPIRVFGTAGLGSESVSGAGMAEPLEV